MLKFFRSMFKSKIGLAIVLGFVALIGVAFALADVSGSGSFGGVSGGDRVAVVGDSKIGTAELATSAQNAMERERAQNPTLSMPAFLAGGGLAKALDDLINRYAIREWAAEYGFMAGDNLINSEIRQIPVFRGANGEFDENAYRQALAQQGLTDKGVRQDIGTSFLAQQTLLPATVGSTIPNSIAYRYAQMFKERRQGSIASLPAGAFAPTADAPEAQLRKFYDGNRSLFIRPERRVLRYATFDAAVLGAAGVPTEAEIAARFRKDAALYAAKETRDITQLVVPTEAAAKAIRAKVAAGASLDAAAQQAGLRAAKLSGATRESVAAQSSQAVAAAYFSAASGTVTAPARSPLGWQIARIDAVKKTPARTLADVRGDIATTLGKEKTTAALNDLASRLESEFAEGATFAEVAKEYKLTVANTKPVVATGQVYGAPAETVPPVLAPALASAFQMEEGEPEIATLPDGQSYLVYDVAEVTPSAAAPFAEIKSDVQIAWKRSVGAARAKAASDRIVARVAKGMPLGAAVAAEKNPGIRIEPVNLTREDLARQRDRRIPPPLVLMFSMAQGTAKKLAEGPNGWFVVGLETITMDKLATTDPLVGQAKQQLGPLFGDELAQQLRVAMRKEMGVEQNDAAIAAVRKQLSGQGN